METEAPGQQTLDDEAATAHPTSNDVGEQTLTKADSDAAGADEAAEGGETDDEPATAEPEA